jgi:starch synthase
LGKKILLVAAELAKLAPVGGIAEYVLGLATALLRGGHDVRVALPAYAFLRSDERGRLRELRARLPVPLGVGASEVTAVHELLVDCPGEDDLRLPVILVGSHKHFDSVYSPGQIYRWPNHEPWIAFSRSVIQYVLSSEWQPEVIHCNDSHAALVPAYVRHLRERGNSFAHATRTVLTIHNLLSQGLGDPGLVSYAGLPPAWFHPERFEYYGQTNCLKGGLVSADRVNTVSRTYVREICESGEYGFGLEGVLRSLRQAGKLNGIVNGIDESRWRMGELEYDGGTDDLDAIGAAKSSCKNELFEEWGWASSKRPLLAFRGRWDTQKGILLLIGSMNRLLELANVAVVTWGYPGSTQELRQAWDRLSEQADRWSDRLAVNRPGITALEQTGKHYILADFFLMPSMYEPCGLVQMECQRYGAIPVVARTGGLVDTVSEERTASLPSPNGFLFERRDADSMIAAVKRAAAAFGVARKMKTLVRNALAQKNGWDSRVGEYEALYGV